jgi:hypothetical protein
MKYVAFLLIFITLLVPAQFEFGHSQQVILLVLDGADPSFFSLEGFPLEGECQAVFPTMTSPGHVSLVTGVYPRRHGILANEYIQEKKTMNYTTDMIEAPTLFEIVQNHGGTGAFISGKKGLAQFLGPKAHICVSPLSYPSYIDPPPQDPYELTEWIFTSIKLVLTHERPDFVCINVPILDEFGHTYGPESEEVKKAVTCVREQIESLVTVLDPGSTLIITADHGMSAVSKAIPIHAMLQNAGFGTWPLHVGRCAFLYGVEEGVPAFLTGIEGVKTVIEPSQYPAYGMDHDNAPDLILLAEEGYLFIPEPLLPYYKGMHGSPDEADIPLYMIGAGVPSGVISCDHVDIAPLICSLLQIESDVQFDGVIPQVKEKEARGYGIAVLLGIAVIILFKKFLRS